jgi:hypothetical protein
MTNPHQAGGVTFLDGLGCIWCHTVNSCWLWADGTTVECGECGQTSLTLPEMTGEGA